MTRKPSKPTSEFKELTKFTQLTAITWHTITCELITPMYGGGTVSTKIDEKMPIRASAIRGQLRSWWRLLAKHKWQLGGDTAIRIAEFELWGGVSDGDDDGTAGKVLLKVTNTKNVVVEQWAVYNPNKDNKFVLSPKDWANAPYALFSAQGKLKKGRTEVDEQPHELLKAGMTWCLHVAFISNIEQSQIKQVWETVRWWANFGGVGARTRRGLGAIKVEKNEFFQSVIALDEIQSLGFGVKTFSANNAYSAWTNAIKKLQTFRQAGLGRKDNSSRSHWSEPDSIRYYTGQSLPKHSQRKTQNNAFPRASFGLPIIFKFKDNNPKGDDLSPNVDPHKTTLTLKYKNTEYARLASPLILRPYIDDEGKWHSLALVLDEVLYDKDNYQLMLNNTEVDFWDESFAKEVKPLENRHEKPLQAFLTYFAK